MAPATYASINLNAINHNVLQVKKFAPDAKIMAVVKANAYGHGLKRIAAQIAGVNALAVARVDEGISLRNSGFEKEIVVLEGFVNQDELYELISYDLTLVIHNHHQLEILINCTRKGRVKAWLKFDTGMSRLGFDSEQIRLIFQQLQSISVIRQPPGIMTHLANADDLSHSGTHAQMKLFADQTLHIQTEKSIANSAGIIAWPDSISDWVRPGIMLYGVSPFSDRNGATLGLKTVMALNSRVIAVKQLKAGTAIGYGSTWVSDKSIKMGVIAIGYGDGYPRSAQSGTPVLVNGSRVPLIGRVSMDMITVDLSKLSDVQPGDPVTLWGEELPVEEIAQWANTIPYTLLCGITQRVDIVEI